jgi:hypothetical protein
MGPWHVGNRSSGGDWTKVAWTDEQFAFILLNDASL